MSSRFLRSFQPRAVVAAAIVALGAGGVFWQASNVDAAEQAVRIPAPAVDETSGGGMKTAVFAGGCFWGVQAVFQHTDGVANAVSGYAGGKTMAPSYSEVSSGSTGHAEAVQVTYDPSRVSYGKLLQIFFSVAHDPTQLNRQGPDTGTQYRSALFTLNDEQKKVADAYVAQLTSAGVYGGSIVTQIAPLSKFYKAEDYHQDYATIHPDQPYIVYNDLPKIANLKTMFPELWRETPALVFARNSGA